MRMWMVDPRLMCRNHLLGEHKEVHMLAGTLLRGKSIQGWVDQGLIDPASVRERHDELVSEMKRRGYNHKSPLPESFPDPSHPMISVEDSHKELKRRCSKCARMDST